jgi:hypothetical protein
MVWWYIILYSTMICRFISLKWKVALALKCTRFRKVSGSHTCSERQGDPKHFRTKDLGSRFATSRKVPVVRDLPCHVSVVPLRM